ncbi:MAG: glycosyltransferase family 2 protein [Acidiferrobacteraceae bacterium]
MTDRSETIRPTPRVSVILPTHNRPRMLERAMRSVLRQTVSDWDLIVVDDGSEEATGHTIRTFADSRIIMLRNPVALGAAGARNAGIRRARTPYLGFLDDDDEYLPDFLSTALAAFENDRRLGFLWTAVVHVTDNGKCFSPLIAPLIHPLTYFAASHGFVVRAAALENVGLFDETLRVSEDTDLVLRLAASGVLYRRLDIPFVRISVHSGPSLSRGNNFARNAWCESRAISKNYAFLRKTPALLVHYLDSLAGTYYRACQYQQAHSVMWQLLCAQPFRLRTFEKWIRFEVRRLFTGCEYWNQKG